MPDAQGLRSVTRALPLVLGAALAIVACGYGGGPSYDTVRSQPDEVARKDVVAGYYLDLLEPVDDRIELRVPKGDVAGLVARLDTSDGTCAVFGWNDEVIVWVRELSNRRLKPDYPVRVSSVGDATFEYCCLELASGAIHKTASEEEWQARIESTSKTAMPTVQALSAWWPNWKYAGYNRAWVYRRSIGIDPASQSLDPDDRFRLTDGDGVYLVLERRDSRPGSTRWYTAFDYGDVFRVAIGESFVLLEQCYLQSTGTADWTVDLSRPTAFWILDTTTGKAMGPMPAADFTRLRTELGIPSDLTLTDVKTVWPDWPATKRPWRQDPDVRTHLRLDE